MERLTSNKSVSEMSMYELAHNSCYAKDGKARVRDFEDDSDARELAIKLLEKYADIPNEFTCDEDFDDFMADSLQYGTDDSALGLIAVFYRNLWAMADLRERLKEYEDLEEQGKILKLSVAVGDTVYTNCSMQGWYFRKKNQPYAAKVVFVGINGADNYINVDFGNGHMMQFNFSCFGKTVFLTREDAEASLKEL